MKVFYAYCLHCGMEWLDEIFLKHLGRYANGDFLQCDNCNGSIGPGNYDLEDRQELDNV